MFTTERTGALVFRIKRSTEEAFAVPFRVSGPKIYYGRKCIVLEFNGSKGRQQFEQNKIDLGTS